MTTVQEKLPWMSDSWERLLYSTEFIGKKIQDKIVLDLGCSAGHQTVFLGKCWQPQKITGVDNFGHEGGAPKCKIEFHENVKSSGCANIDLEVSDVFSLPYSPSSIDVIVCSQAMHHFFVTEKDLRRLEASKLKLMQDQLAEWIRVIKPGGYLIIKDTSRYSVLRFLAWLGIFKAARRLEFETKQEARAWVYLLERAGFIVEEVEYYVPYSLRLLKPLLRRTVFCSWISMTYFIRARVSK